MVVFNTSVFFVYLRSRVHTLQRHIIKNNKNACLKFMKSDTHFLCPVAVVTSKPLAASLISPKLPLHICPFLATINSPQCSEELERPPVVEMMFRNFS